jgi:hypothetical protein
VCICCGWERGSAGGSLTAMCAEMGSPDGDGLPPPSKKTTSSVYKSSGDRAPLLHLTLWRALLASGSEDEGFAKRKMCRRRERREEPRSGSGIRRRCLRWPKKLAEPSSEVRRNASCRCKGCTSEFRASRATPSYI